MSGSTSSLDGDSPRPRARRPTWALTVALDGERVAEPPRRLALNAVTEIEVGRGERRAAKRTGSRLRLDLPDRWASRVHARFTTDGETWTVEDAGSKNGTYVGERRIDRAALDDGAVIACGATFLVLRRAAGPIEDLEAPRQDLDALRTMSPALERELALLPKIARSRLPVLVRGDSGTGKEVAANAVHRLSGRKGPFIAVNCGAIPPALIESELFGSRRGAFSGAENRPGLVRNAEGGTLFLDEVAELPLPSQVALLRVLQEGEVLPLGEGKPVKVDVRVVAATHQPLDKLLDKGLLRRDLVARLRGYELRLPRLRERREDLGLLIASLLERIEAPARRFTRPAARALFAHAWPFNIRELEQTLRAAVAIADGDAIDVAHLRLGTFEVDKPKEGPRTEERDRLVAALEKHGGNVSAVARAFATSRSQVQRMLARHSLDPSDFARR